MRIPGLALAAALLAGAARAGADVYQAWIFRRDIGFNTTAAGANVAATVADFPLCVRLNAGNFDFSKAKADGSDLRFADADGTPLAYEIERWDKAKAVAEIWVKVPMLDGNSSADRIVMHWGKADAASESDGRKVFAAAAGYLGAWHLSEGGTGARRNSAGTANPATPGNYDGDESRPGVVGLADSLVSSSSSSGPDPWGGGGSTYTGDYLDLGAGFADFTKGFTYSVWAWFSGRNPYERLLDLGGGPNSQNIILSREDATDNLYFENFAVPARPERIVAKGAIPAPSWQHYAVTMTDRSVRIYRNGALIQTGAVTTAIQVFQRTQSFIGRSNWTQNAYFHGKVDQPEISNVSRGDDWIRLSYESQRTDSKLLAFGPVQETRLAVTAQPAASVSLRETQALTLTVTGVSTRPITYTWFQDGQPKASSNSGTYSIAAARLSDAGTWSCKLTDGAEEAASAATVVTVSENPALWTRSMDITLNTTAAFANTANKVVDFPLLLRLDASNFDFSQAVAGGADIRFLDAAGNFLPHYLARWRADLQAAEAWVHLAEVAPSTGSNKVRMIWGRADAVQRSDGAAVFPKAKGWRGAWNLDETSGTAARDATGNGFAGEITGAAGDVPGVAGKGFRFAGGGDRVAVPAATLDTLRAFSVMLWARETHPAECLTDWQCPTLFGAETVGAASEDFWIYSKDGMLSVGHGILAAEAPVTGDKLLYAEVPLDDGKWHHVAVTWNGKELVVHEGGRGVISTATAAGPLAPAAYDIGNLRFATGARTNGFRGDIDEPQALSQAVSADWIKLAYETQRPDAFAVGYGAPAVLPLVPVSAFPPAGTYPAPLVVTLTAGDGAGILYTVDGTPAKDNPAALSYTGPFTLPRDARVRAVAHKDGKASEELIADYELSRTLDPGGRDTLRAGDTVSLGDGFALTPGPASGSPVISVERLPLPGSVTGFDRTGPLLRAAPLVPGGAFPGLWVLGPTDGVALYRFGADGATRMPARDGGLWIPAAGDLFWGRDTTAPRILWLDSRAAGAGGADSVRAAFRVHDNTARVGVLLRYHSGGEDSIGWREVRSGDSLPFSIAVPADAGPVELSFTATDGAFTVRYPASDYGSITLSRPLPAASPIALPADGRWTLAGLPVESGSPVTLAGLSQANGGAVRAALWEEKPGLPGTGSYRILGDGDALPTGRALWLSAASSHAALVIPSPRSRASDSSGDYSVRLGPGWNLVANPSLRPLPWPVRRADLDAYTASAVKGPHAHDGDRYSPSDTLLPWRGYYVFNHGADTVIRLGGGGWLAVKRTTPAPKRAATTRPEGIDLLFAGSDRSAARLGARAWAADGLGREDELSPPPPSKSRRSGIWLLRDGRALGTDVVRWQDGGVSRWTLASRGASPPSLSALAAPEGTEVWAAFPSRGLRLRLGAGDALPVALEDTVQVFAGPPAALASLPELRGLAAAPAGAEARLVRGPSGWELALALPGSARVRVRAWRAEGGLVAGFEARKAAGWHRIPLQPRGRGSGTVVWVRIEVWGEGWSLRRLLPANFSGIADLPR